MCLCVERKRERALQVGAGTGQGERSVVQGGSMASSHGRSDLRFADWMASLPQSMHTIPLTNLAIPGKCFFFFFFKTLSKCNRMRRMPVSF